MNVFSSINFALYVNANELKVVHFQKSTSRKKEYHFNKGTEIVDLVQQYTYLGILLDEHLKFHII